MWPITLTQKDIVSRAWTTGLSENLFVFTLNELITDAFQGSNIVELADVLGQVSTLSTTPNCTWQVVNVSIVFQGNEPLAFVLVLVITLTYLGVEDRVEGTGFNMKSTMIALYKLVTELGM